MVYIKCLREINSLFFLNPFTAQSKLEVSANNTFSQNLNVALKRVTENIERHMWVSKQRKGE